MCDHGRKYYKVKKSVFTHISNGAIPATEKSNGHRDFNPVPGVTVFGATGLFQLQQSTDPGSPITSIGRIFGGGIDGTVIYPYFIR
jgi:hypothetical protein